jgi:hypothetical protein
MLMRVSTSTTTVVVVVVCWLLQVAVVPVRGIEVEGLFLVVRIAPMPTGTLSVDGMRLPAYSTTVHCIASVRRDNTFTLQLDLMQPNHTSFACLTTLLCISDRDAVN